MPIPQFIIDLANEVNRAREHPVDVATDYGRGVVMSAGGLLDMFRNLAPPDSKFSSRASYLPSSEGTNAHDLAGNLLGSTGSLSERGGDFVGAIPGAGPAAKAALALGAKAGPVAGLLGSMISKGAGAAGVKMSKARVGTTGAYVGAPPGIDSPQAFAALTRRYLKNVEDGAVGAPWYDKSSDFINVMTGGDHRMADSLVSGISATSSQTKVPTNFNFAVKGHNQAMAGETVNTGRRPASMSPKVQQAYDDPYAYYLGHKQEPFQQQLAINWDPNRVGRGVNDMWETIAMGYPTRAPGPAQHAFMDKVRENAMAIANREKIGGRSDWTTGRLQAANWVAQKAKTEGTSIETAAKDFADVAQARMALMSRESMPGAATGHMPELSGAGEQAALDYHAQQNKILLDPMRRDKTLSGVGLLTGPISDTPGYWKGTSNPSSQAPFLVGLDTPEVGPRTFDAGTRKLTDAAAMWHALFGAQEATAGHFLTPGTMKDATVSSFNIGRSLTTPEMKSIGGLLDSRFPGGASPVGTGSGVNVLRDSSNGPADFGNQMKSFGQDVKAITNVEPQIAHGQYGDTGVYAAPDWNGSGFSPATNSALPALTSTPKIEKAIDSPHYREMAGKLAELDDAVAKTGNYTVNEKLQVLRRGFAEGGLARVRELAAKGLVPAAFVGYLGLNASPDAELAQ
jgi:hypothetical protein